MSRNARRRAGVLAAVHALFAAHLAHYLTTGKTLSPVEPSESMYTLELGQLNAGFVFFAVVLVTTLVFGRFFCGWGCHLVALQDLCGWLMKRLGIRPRPFRSRLLLWVPLAVAIYMFVWPTVKRIWFAGPGVPELSNHFVTDDFWRTFPGPLFALLTFLSCGFAAVYLLGAKGFCTYGCPYGALFVITDRLSPGRIVVDDSCEQCGHCTATCTSNVLVHDEVRRFGRVVDPGCMKCMDCVSVCPNGALSFSFGRPALWGAKGSGRRWDLSLAQELAAGLVCIGSTFAFRGLYDGPPLLMAVALGGITAFISSRVWHLLRRPDVRLQNLTLKLTGRLSPAGRWFLLLAGIWIAFVAHSGFVQWHRAWGGYHLQRTEAEYADVLAGSASAGRYSQRHRRSAERSFRHFRAADRWGLVPVIDVKRGLAWGHLLRGELDPALEAMRAARQRAPLAARLHGEIVELLIARGRPSEAAAALAHQIDVLGGQAAEWCRLGELRVATERIDPALEAFRRCVELRPDDANARYNLGGLLRRAGRPGQAVVELEKAAELAPRDAATRVELGLSHAATGDKGAAVECLRQAIELAPESPESLVSLPRLIEELERAP